MLERLKDYDWAKAFEYAGVEPRDEKSYSSRDGQPNVSPVLGWDGDASGFTREDVVEIVAMSDGAHDEQNWIGFFKLKDGRYAFLSAGCDYTGWDCQASGHAIVGPDKETMLRLGIGKEDKSRLGL